MSGVPTICSRARLLCTVLRPLAPRTIAAIPKATSTMLAATPPYSKSLRVVNMATPFASFLFMPQVSIGVASPASGRCRRLAAAFPQAWRGFWRDRFARTGLYDCPAMASARESDRLRTLLETGIAISSELSLDTVLERIVEAAAALTGARYAALGVIDRSGTALERFVTTGFDEETRAAIGDLPRGRGILGVLIREAQVLRLHDLQQDPRSVGFPPNHPAMHSFLGVPILLRGVAYGNLYLTEKEGGDAFSEEDEEVVTLLAAQAAVAVENARLYEMSTAWSRQLESLNEIGNALVGELDLPKLLDLVAKRLRELIDARLVVIALPQADALRVEAAAGDVPEPTIGIRLPRDSKAGRVLERRRSERIDSMLEDPEVHQESARLFAATAGLFGLKAVEEARTPAETEAAAEQLRELVVATLQDVRRLAVELRPQALDDFGLVDALERLASTFSETTGIAVDLEATLGAARLPGEVETTLYRILQEALTNIVKHARARKVSIILVRREGKVTALVEDDGEGFDPDAVRADGLGLLGMRERVGLVDGRLTLESSPGAGTTLAVEVPLP